MSGLSVVPLAVTSVIEAADKLRCSITSRESLALCLLSDGFRRPLKISARKVDVAFCVAVSPLITGDASTCM